MPQSRDINELSWNEYVAEIQRNKAIIYNFIEIYQIIYTRNLKRYNLLIFVNQGDLLYPIIVKSNDQLKDAGLSPAQNVFVRAGRLNTWECPLKILF